MERAQNRPSELLQGLKQLCCDEGLRAGAAQPGAEDTQRSHPCPLIPEGRCGEDGARLYALMPSGARTRGNEHKLERRRFPLPSGSTLCCAGCRALEQAAQRGRGVSLEISQNHPCTVLGSSSGYPCLSRALDLVSSRGPFQLQPLCDSLKAVRLLTLFSLLSFFFVLLNLLIWVFVSVIYVHTHIHVYEF